MKKLLKILYLTLFLFGCSSDNNTAINNEPNATLIIKNIVNVDENGISKNYYFSTSGTLDSITQSYPNIDFKTTYTYNSNNKLTSEFSIIGTETIDDKLTYSNNQFSAISRIGLNSSFNSNIDISNDTLSYVIPTYDISFIADATVKIAFENSSETISGYKIPLSNNGFNIPVYNEEVFSYDNNGNLNNVLMVVQQGNTINETKSYTYDNRKNPFAESMLDTKTSYLLLNSYYGISIDKLIELSPNNILTISNYQNTVIKTYNYEYNNDNYPVSATVTNSSNNQITNTITYTYY